MAYFTKSQIFSDPWPFTYAGNKLYLHKKRKLLLMTNINHNVGDSVADGDSFWAEMSLSTVTG